MIAYPTLLMRLIRLRSQITAVKKAARHGFVAVKVVAIGTELYLALVFSLRGYIHCLPANPPAWRVE